MCSSCECDFFFLYVCICIAVMYYDLLNDFLHLHLLLSSSIMSACPGWHLRNLKCRISHWIQLLVFGHSGRIEKLRSYYFFPLPLTSCFYLAIFIKIQVNFGLTYCQTDVVERCHAYATTSSTFWTSSVTTHFNFIKISNIFMEYFQTL